MSNTIRRMTRPFSSDDQVEMTFPMKRGTFPQKMQRSSIFKCLRASLKSFINLFFPEKSLSCNMDMLPNVMRGSVCSFPTWKDIMSRQNSRCLSTVFRIAPDLRSWHKGRICEYPRRARKDVLSTTCTRKERITSCISGQASSMAMIGGIFQYELRTGILSKENRTLHTGTEPTPATTISILWKEETRVCGGKRSRHWWHKTVSMRSRSRLW